MMWYISHDCIFKDINQLMFFSDILRCREKVHDNKDYSHGNSNLR